MTTFFLLLHECTGKPVAAWRQADKVADICRHARRRAKRAAQIQQFYSYIYMRAADQLISCCCLCL